MATVHIPAPVLIGTQFFVVRWRELPNGIWSAPQNEDNDPFVIAGISGNQAFELEITLYDDNGQLCPPKYKRYNSVEPNCECPDNDDIEAAITVDSNGVVHFTISGFDTLEIPLCGYEIKLTPNNLNPPITIYETAAPASGSYEYTMPAYLVGAETCWFIEVFALCCGDNEWNRTACFSSESICPEPEPCTPFTSTSAQLFFDTSNPNLLFLQISFTQSNPVTTSMGVVWNQTNNLYSGFPDTGNTIITPVLASPIFVPLNPNLNVAGDDLIRYTIKFDDICGTQYLINVVIDLP